MNVVTAQEMMRIEAVACAGGVEQEIFMEKVGIGIAHFIQQYIWENKRKKNITFLCGKGNNAGDAYMTAIIFKRRGYAVKVFQLFPLSEGGVLMRRNYDLFLKERGDVSLVTSAADIVFPQETLIVDGIFGTGFRGATEGVVADVIRCANSSGCPIMAIDIPSGLNGTTGEVKNTVIHATKTLFLGLPKTGFFLQSGWDHIGDLEYIDCGLGERNEAQALNTFTMITADNMRSLLPVIIPSRHKYQAGYLVAIAGSKGMAGAALLASDAALRSGAGIVRLFHPLGMEAELSAAPYELIKQGCGDSSSIKESFDKASAIVVGPGLGRSAEAKKLLEEILPALGKPCVIDADALFFVAEYQMKLPPKAILTPHLGEMARLLGVASPASRDREFLEKCQRYADENGVTIVLKGGPTFIFHPGITPAVSVYGSPGMATAGCGDVLTGLVGSLLSQGMMPYDAACLAVYLHGRAGMYAAEELTPYCMVASDVIHFFPQAFESLL